MKVSYSLLPVEEEENKGEAARSAPAVERRISAANSALGKVKTLSRPAKVFFELNRTESYFLLYRGLLSWSMLWCVQVLFAYVTADCCASPITLVSGGWQSTDNIFHVCLPNFII